MTAMTHLPKQLRTRRDATGLSRERFAAKAGVSSATVFRVENGLSPNTSAETLQRFAEALGCTLADLLAPVEA